MWAARLARCLLATILAGSPAVPGPHAYVVVVDGLDRRQVTPERMPTLYDPEATGGRPVTEARAVMPARTNPNHASLLTGVYPEAHGITGNAWWSRDRLAGVEKLDAARLLEVETLFTVAERVAPTLVTMGFFAKPKLGRLFAGVGGRQAAPDVLWSADAVPATGRDPVTGYATDAATMDAALAAVGAREPDLLVLTLADVDRTAHGFGPDAPEAVAAVTGADRAIRRLVDDLRTRGRWERSLVIVTADHGFDTIDETLALGPRLAAAGVAGVRLVGEGGVEHVYAEVLDAATPRLLGRVADIARATAGVAEVLARIDVPGVRRLEVAYPDWHAGHERLGELLLVATPGRHFVEAGDRGEARLRGNHGGPGDRRVPLAVLGGWIGWPPAAAAAPPSVADLGATVGRSLGLRPPWYVAGGDVEAPLRGVPIADGVTAQSPHCWR